MLPSRDRLKVCPGRKRLGHLVPNRGGRLRGLPIVSRPSFGGNVLAQHSSDRRVRDVEALHRELRAAKKVASTTP